MFKIRKGMFETNSSSAHVLILSDQGEDHDVDEDTVVSPQLGEYGWGYDELIVFQKKLSYIVSWVASFTFSVINLNSQRIKRIYDEISWKAFGDPSAPSFLDEIKDLGNNRQKCAIIMKLLDEILQERVGKTVNWQEVDRAKLGASIDHQSLDVVPNLFSQGKESVEMFLFNSKSRIFIANDNEESPELNEFLFDQSCLRPNLIRIGRDMYREVAPLQFPFVYNNGNTVVTIYKDGTKVRHYLDPENPVIEFPESIDLKISNKCSQGCAFCHEDSTLKGEIAPLYSIKAMLQTLHPGTEIAFGGGDVFTADIASILKTAKKRGIISNITVHENQFIEHAEEIQDMIDRELVYGIGVSYAGKDLPFIPENMVCHLIYGVHSKEEIEQAAKKYKKLLILGFKTVGRGLVFESSPRGVTKEFLANLSKTNTVAFDSLAVKQLKMEESFAPKEWEKLYMGDDGKYTMFYDAVNDEAAISSSHSRFAANGVMDGWEIVKQLSEKKK